MLPGYGEHCFRFPSWLIPSGETDTSVFVRPHCYQPGQGSTGKLPIRGDMNGIDIIDRRTLES